MPTTELARYTKTIRTPKGRRIITYSVRSNKWILKKTVIKEKDCKMEYPWIRDKRVKPNTPFYKVHEAFAEMDCYLEYCSI